MKRIVSILLSGWETNSSYTDTQMQAPAVLAVSVFLSRVCDLHARYILSSFCASGFIGLMTDLLRYAVEF